MPALNRRSLLWQLPLFLLTWCLIVEVLVRTFLVSPSNIPDDAVLGWRWPRSSTFLTETEAGYRRIHTNALGFNDDPIGPRDGRTRFLVLGDSYVEALQVPQQKNFMHLIEHDMPQFQMINAGQSGLDPISELVVFDRLDKKLSPDGVILVLDHGDKNDLLGDRIKVRHCPGSRAICGYRLPKKSEGTIKGWLKPVMARSALITFLLRKYKAPVNQALGELQHVMPRINSNSTPHAFSGWEDFAQSDIEPLLKFLFARIHGRGPLIVVYIPPLDFTVDEHTNRLGSKNFVVGIARAAREVGVPLVNARDALSEAYAKHDQPPLGFDFSILGANHLNALGHRALAKALEKELAKLAKHSSQ